MSYTAEQLVKLKIKSSSGEDLKCIKCGSKISRTNDNFYRTPNGTYCVGCRDMDISDIIEKFPIGKF